MESSSELDSMVWRRRRGIWVVSGLPLGFSLRFVAVAKSMVLLGSVTLPEGCGTRAERREPATIRAAGVFMKKRSSVVTDGSRLRLADGSRLAVAVAGG